MNDNPKSSLDKFINLTLNRSLGAGLEKLLQSIENDASKEKHHAQVQRFS